MKIIGVIIVVYEIFISYLKNISYKNMFIMLIELKTKIYEYINHNKEKLYNFIVICFIFYIFNFITSVAITIIFLTAIKIIKLNKGK